MKRLQDIDVKDRVVLVRVDYNVPMEQDETGQWVVADDFRIRASLPTIQYLQEHEAKKIVLISHLGRPEGREEKYSLTPVMLRLAELLAEAGLEQVELLENLRFDPREKANDISFAEELVQDTGAEIFVQDGFGVLHRATASTVAITRLLPSVAGLLVQKEVDALTAVMDAPEKPLVVVMGGAKVEDKAPLIEKFTNISDKILVGGKIAVELTENPMSYSFADNVYVAEDFDEDGEGMKLDIGPVATANFIKELEKAKTVLWNGTLGKVEDPAFATSSEIVAKFLGERNDIKSVICGGDTVGFVTGLMQKHPDLSYDLVSTGGGASLNLLLGQEMPGLDALN